MRAGGTAVVPSDEPLLEPWLRDDLEVVTFGPGGDVHFEGSSMKSGVVPDALPTRHVVIAQGERVELELPFDQQHNLLNALAALAAARADRGARRAARSTSASPRCGASAWRSGSGPSSSTTATTPTRCPCAPPSTISPRTHAEGRRVAVLGDMLELGPGEREHHREIGAYAASAGRRPARDRRAARRRDARRVRRRVARGRRRRRRPPRCCPSSCAAGDVVLVKALARRRARGRHRGAAGRRLMGEVLIAGTASLLICIFLSPKFIAFLREREFGQHIREEGPQEHHAKAGTPTMGGIIIFTAIAVPFLLLTEFTTARDRRLRRRARVRAARLRRRLHEDRQAALAGAAGAHEARRHDR